MKAPLNVRGLLLDLDGVLTLSAEPLPGAAAAVRRLRDAGLPLRILTNTTAYAAATIGDALRRFGLPVEDDEVITAPVAAVTYLQQTHPGARVHVLGDAVHQDMEPLDRVGLDDDPDVILLSGADESYCFERFNLVLRRLLDGATLVAMHRNLTWMATEGIRLDSGAYLLGLEQAVGRRAVVTGKPAAEFFAAGLRSLGLPAAAVAMVGDDLDNDVLAAQALGITGILVRTGKFRPEVLERAAGRPDRVIDAVSGLPGLF